MEQKYNNSYSNNVQPNSNGSEVNYQSQDSYNSGNYNTQNTYGNGYNSTQNTYGNGYNSNQNAYGNDYNSSQPVYNGMYSNNQQNTSSVTNMGSQKDYYSPNSYEYGFNSPYYQSSSNGYSSSQSTSSYSGVTANRQERVKSVITKSFAYMFIALVISAISASVAYASGMTMDLMLSGGMTGLIVLEIVCVFVASYAMNKNKLVLSAVMSLSYAVINGLTLSVIFYVYQMGSIVNIFFLAALLFGVMAIFGICTKKELTAIGLVGYMLLVSVILLGVGNLFFKSQSFNTALAAVGLAAFIGITAYDLQKIKQMAAERTDTSDMALGMYGGLCIYLDLINIFLKLLILFGKGRD